MSTTFPTSKDNLTNPAGSDDLDSPNHADQHADINDAMEAVQTKVGIDSSSDTSSHDYKITTLENKTSNVDNTSDETLIKKIYPVGSLYITTVSTNPATVLGFGTWTAFGAGKVLVGLDSGDTDFDTSEETGGSKTHTLTTSEIPSHSHTFDYYGVKYVGSGGAQKWPFEAGSTADNNITGTSTDTTGGGSAHTIVQPYIVVYMFKRTA